MKSWVQLYTILPTLIVSLEGIITKGKKGLSISKVPLGTVCSIVKFILFFHLMCLTHDGSLNWSTDGALWCVDGLGGKVFTLFASTNCTQKTLTYYNQHYPTSSCCNWTKQTSFFFYQFAKKESTNSFSVLIFIN